MKHTISNDAANIVFIGIITVFAVLAAVCIATLGFTGLSLALVALCTLLGTFVAIVVENHVNKFIDKQREKVLKDLSQDLGKDNGN